MASTGATSLTVLVVEKGDQDKEEEVEDNSREKGELTSASRHVVL